MAETFLENIQTPAEALVVARALAGLGPRKHDNLPQYGDPLLNRDGSQTGEVRSYKDCNLAGCRGVKIAVRWPDGKLTWPCTRGMRINADGIWQIE